MKITKHVSVLFLITCILLACVGPVAAAQDIKVKYYNQELQLKVEPIIMQGNLMVSYEELFEAMGAKVVWDPYMKLIEGTKGTMKFNLQVGNNRAMVDGKLITLDIAPFNYKGKIVIPVRFIQSLGEKVTWDSVNKVVSIGDTSIKGNLKTTYKSGETLKENTKLEYAAGKSGLFKKGTVVNFYPNGFVKNGTLAEESKLTFERLNNKYITLAPNSAVEFNGQGFIKSGILSYNSRLEFAPLGQVDGSISSSTERNAPAFKAGVPVTFFDNGYVQSGTLYEDTNLPYREYGGVLLKGDNPVTFYQSGYVAQGTLVHDAGLNYKPSATVALKGNCPVSFGSDQLLNSGTLLYDTDLPCNPWGKLVKFKKGCEVTFNVGSFVHSGTLYGNTSLSFNGNSNGIQEAIFKKETEIFIGPDGYVQSGILSRDYYLPVTGGWKSFSAGQKIYFNAQGYVTAG